MYPSADEPGPFRRVNAEEQSRLYPLSLQSVLSLYPDLEQAPDDIERCDYALGEREKGKEVSLSTLYIYYNIILKKIQILIKKI